MSSLCIHFIFPYLMQKMHISVWNLRTGLTVSILKGLALEDVFLSQHTTRLPMLSSSFGKRPYNHHIPHIMHTAARLKHQHLFIISESQEGLLLLQVITELGRWVPPPSQADGETLVSHNTCQHPPHHTSHPTHYQVPKALLITSVFVTAARRRA
jgi:hypothetical protein